MGNPYYYYFGSVGPFKFKISLIQRTSNSADLAGFI